MSTPPTRSYPSSSPGNTERKPGRKGRRRFFSVKQILRGLRRMLLLGVAAFGVAYFAIDIPQPNELAEAQASIVYYADGKTEMARISDDGGNRESVPLSKVPVHLQRALLAAEDRTFYEHNGVSPSGIGRSVFVALKGGSTQGGSTITQQYVKNYFLTQERTITRKARELIISIKIDQQESKETILENYLNTIYFGRGAFGVQTAAKAYFGRDVSTLTVAEGALLASVIRAPELYDPANGDQQNANAKARVDYVLDGMVSQGWLSPQERAKASVPTTVKRARLPKAGPLGFITAEVRNELKAKLGLTDTDIDRGGLRIVTTIDKKAQDSAIKAVAEKMPSEQDAKDLHIGLTAIKPGDGAIVAMYGGKDFSGGQNSSTEDIMQGGSTFKVFGLLAAGQRGISTKTKFDGHSPQSFPQFADRENPGGRVVNFDREQFGTIDLRSALAHSVNTVFAQLNIMLADGGKQATAVRDAAILAGLPKGCPPGDVSGKNCTVGLATNMTNILGTASPHVIDMANAFATIAAQGQRARPYLITVVTSIDGGTDYIVEKDLTRAFDPKVTADVTDAMTFVVTEKGATGNGALELGRPAAGKTGTATENEAVWFDGFTPQLAAAVGMFQGKGGRTKITIKGITQATGGDLPVKVWTAFMKGALEGEKVMDFPKPAGLGDDMLPTATAEPVKRAPTTTAPTTAPSTTASPTVAPTKPRPAKAGPVKPLPVRRSGRNLGG